MASNSKDLSVPLSRVLALKGTRHCAWFRGTGNCVQTVAHARQDYQLSCIPNPVCLKKKERKKRRKEENAKDISSHPCSDPCDGSSLPLCMGVLEVGGSPDQGTGRF